MTVKEAAAASCDTSTVLGLSRQIIAEIERLRPHTLVAVSSPRFEAPPRVNAFLQPAAAAALYGVLAEGGRTLSVASAYRTVAQQELLYTWYRAGRCGIPLAAKPGASNHEDGAALDVQDSDFWRPFFIRHGWKWQGPQDPSHYSYRGPGFQDGIGALGVRAFQSLHNHSTSGVDLAEDGVFGAAMEAALAEVGALVAGAGR